MGPETTDSGHWTHPKKSNLNVNHVSFNQPLHYISRSLKDCMDEAVEERMTSFCDEEEDDKGAAAGGGLLSEIENALGMGLGTF